MGGAIYLDYSQAITETVGEIGIKQINVLKPEEQIFYPSITGNSFVNNRAKLGGAAIRINGLIYDDLSKTDNREYI